MSRKKDHVKLIDIETREIVGEGELTPAAVKRLIKLYQVHGFYLEAVA
jgi:hypothetical protein